MAGPLCEHLGGISLDPMPAGGCIDCLAIGSTWVHLRYCVTCRETRCCDSSVNKHASRHAAESEHLVVRSKEPGEQWVYCFADDVIARTGSA